MMRITSTDANVTAVGSSTITLEATLTKEELAALYRAINKPWLITYAMYGVRRQLEHAMVRAGLPVDQDDVEDDRPVPIL